MKKYNISVIGAGSWGASLAYLFSLNKQCQVSIWDRNPQKLEEIKTAGHFPHPREIVKYSPDQYTLTSDLEQAYTQADIVVCAIPSEAITSHIQTLKELNIETLPIILSATKGLDQVTGQTMFQLWQSHYSNINYIALSGPNLSAEVAQCMPMKTILAGNNLPSVQLIQELLKPAKHFKTEVIEDIIGQEICGAIKNIIAVGAGAWDGFNLGTSGKGCFLTKATENIKKFIKLYNGQEETANTVAGLGDLIITCSSELSRNYRTGYYLSKGHALTEITELLKGQVAEGVSTTNLIKRICEENNFECPFVQTIYNLIHDDLSSKSKQEEYKALLSELI